MSEGLVKLPLTLTAEVEERKMPSIADDHFGGNYLSINKQINQETQLSVSKAFSKSTLYIAGGIFLLEQKAKISLAVRKDSLNDRPLTKAV